MEIPENIDRGDLVQIGPVVQQALRLGVTEGVSGVHVALVTDDEAERFVPCDGRTLNDICEDVRLLTDDGWQLLGFVWDDAFACVGGRLLRENEGNPDGPPILARVVAARARETGRRVMLEAG
jgi:hypothetical protein